MPTPTPTPTPTPQQKQKTDTEETRPLDKRQGTFDRRRSNCRWKQMARPFCIYSGCAILLASIPVGLLAVASPRAAADFTAGFGGWLAAIPKDVLTYLGVVTTGYIAGRSVEKIKNSA